MSNRIREMRLALVLELKKAGSKLDWSHVTT
jgi:aspartate/tyrosine/aromatic aminotransferase